MHGRSRLALDRLRHEGRIHVVLQRGFPDRALEQEHLVGKLDRIAVTQIDFELRRAFLVDQRVDLEALALGEVIDVVDEFVELVDAGDGIPLSAADRAARASDRRRQRIIGIRIFLDEIELDFRRDDRLQALLVVGGNDALQDVTRREFDGLPVLVDEIADDLRSRVGFPMALPRASKGPASISDRHHPPDRRTHGRLRDRSRRSLP